MPRLAHSRQRSTSEMLLHSLKPSASSLLLSALFGILMIGLHLLLISANAETVLPNVFGSEWLQTYTDFVIKPLRSFFNNSLLNNVLTALLWAAIGLVIYSAIELVINSWIKWRTSAKEILIGTNRKIVHHPLRGALIGRTVWRVCVSWGLILATIALQPLFRHIFMTDRQLLSGNFGLQKVWPVVLNVPLWILIIHLYVVLLRWYLFRTRVFGEIV